MTHDIDITNLTLIGMPGVGKSTIGVLLAKARSMKFLDTDIIIQDRESKPLQQIIDEIGMEAFCNMEERYIRSLYRCNTVIATGGSAIYGHNAMSHLQTLGPVIFLYLPLIPLMQRLGNIATRGIAIKPGQTFEDLYNQRQIFYERYATITIDTTGLDHNATLAAIQHSLSQ